MPEVKQCQTCKWWVRQTRAEVSSLPNTGCCHVRPPLSGLSDWPWTYKNDFCREWEKKTADV